MYSSYFTNDDINSSKLVNSIINNSIRKYESDKEQRKQWYENFMKKSSEEQKKIDERARRILSRTISDYSF